MFFSNLFKKETKNKYDIDINGLSCTCPDWIETRQQFNTNNPARLCKHLISQINLDNLNDELIYYKDEIEFCQINNWGFKKSFNKILKIPNTTYRVLYNEYGDWNELFDKNANRYAFTLHPYDVSEDLVGSEGCIKWAKDEKPLDYKEIEAFFVGEEFQLPFSLSKREEKDLQANLQMKFQETIRKINIDYSQYSHTTNNLHYVLNIFFDKRDEEMYDLKVTNQIIIVNNDWEQFTFYRKRENIQLQKEKRTSFIKRYKDEKQKRLFETKDCELNYKRPKDILKDYDISFGLIKFYRLLVKNGYAKKTISQYDNSIRYYPTQEGEKYSKIF